MAAIAVNSDNFQKVVLESDKPVLVDFWASWCGPCKMLSPVVEELAEAHPEIAVAKVNVDENPELAMVYRISAIPALILFRDGKVAKQSVGYQPREALEELLKCWKPSRPSTRACGSVGAPRTPCCWTCAPRRNTPQGTFPAA